MYNTSQSVGAVAAGSSGVALAATGYTSGWAMVWLLMAAFALVALGLSMHRVAYRRKPSDVSQAVSRRFTITR